MKQTVKYTIYILLAVLLLNIVSYFVFIRWDFTANKRYSLSPVSKNIVKENKLPVVIDFYVTEDLPQDMAKLAKEFLALLKEYKSLSNVSFTVNTIYPNTSEKSFKATEAGIQPIFKEFRKEDFDKIQKIFIGAVFKIGDTQSVLPLITYTTPLEYEITRLLKQATHPRKPHIGFLSGHDEVPLTRMPQLINELSHLTEISVVDLANDIPQNQYNVICIIGAKDYFTPLEIERLNTYLNQGGRLFIALHHAVGQVNSYNGFINRTGLENMLEEKGLKVQYDFVVDNNCGTITFYQQYGMFNWPSTVSFPYLPIINNFSNHIITLGLNSMLLPYVSSIEQVKTKSPYIYTSLAKSSSASGLQQAPISFNLQKQWKRSDFQRPHNTVAALLTNDDNHSAIVTIANAEFITDETIRAGHTDNINFAVNSIEWLADNTGLIKLRNKFTTFATIKPIDEYTKESLKYINFFLPILIILVAAAINYRRNQRKRINRSRPGYID